MKRANLARLAAVLAFAAVGSASPGCGGGGGTTTPCGLPGTLVALALEGAPAPGTVGGFFAAIPAQVDVAAADGGWVAFVADVTGGTTTKGLFAAEPNGTVHLVYAKGEAVPAPGTGTIDNFDRVFVTPGGVIVTHVEIVAGNTFGILTARIDGAGAVVEKDSAIYSGVILPPSAQTAAVAGALSAVDDDRMQVDDQGSTVFIATGTGGGTPPRGVYRVDRAGALVESLAQTGDVMVVSPEFRLTDNFDNLAIDGDGVLIAYASTDLTSGKDGLLVTNGTVTALLAKEDDVAPSTGGRLFTNFSSGVLAVNEVFPNGFVFWQAGLSGGTPNTGVFSRQVSPTVGTLTALATPGTAAPGAGPLAALTAIRLLRPENDPSAITIEADITGGDTFRIYFSIPSPGALNEIWRQGEIAPDAGGIATFTLAHPSTTLVDRSATDRFGSPAFTAVLSDVSTGVWWAIRDCNFFKVALEGETAPGTVGGTFNSFATPSTLTVAVDNLVFRAAIAGGANPTGIYRQH